MSTDTRNNNPHHHSFSRLFYLQSFRSIAREIEDDKGAMSECIYKFVEQPQPKKHKKQIYRSKYDPNGPLIGSTFCMQGTTAVDGKGFHTLKKVREDI